MSDWLVVECGRAIIMVSWSCFLQKLVGLKGNMSIRGQLVWRWCFRVFFLCEPRSFCLAVAFRLDRGSWWPWLCLLLLR